MEKYKVSINFKEIIKAKSPEEAKFIFWNMFDNSFLKVDVEKLN